MLEHPSIRRYLEISDNASVADNQQERSQMIEISSETIC